MVRGLQRGSGERAGGERGIITLGDVEGSSYFKIFLVCDNSLRGLLRAFNAVNSWCCLILAQLFCPYEMKNLCCPYALVSGKPHTPIPGECGSLAGDFSDF